MSTQVQVLESRQPDLVRGHPTWWHHPGQKMRVVSLKDKRELVIKGSAATVTIRRDDQVVPSDSSCYTGWVISWEVVEHVAFDQVSRGNRHFSNEELAAAFGITDESGRYGSWLLERYGGDAAEQMLFIRWREYLNIPCPGTGYDGDPNVSVYVSLGIKDAVRSLLRAA